MTKISNVEKRYRNKFIQKILESAKSEMEQVVRYIKNPFDPASLNSANEFLNRAHSLIELAETMDCGCYGGFGLGQEEKDRENIMARHTWLTKKYCSRKNK